jgi:hypothetical protein
MKYDDDNNNNKYNNNNNVDDTDGTMIVLTVAWMAEDFNAGVQFPLGTLVPTKPLVKCWSRGGFRQLCRLTRL